MKYTFGQIAINSTAKRKPTEEDKINYIGLEHLSSETFDIPSYGSEVAPIGEKLIIKKGDILFGKRRAYQRKVGISPIDGIFSAHGFVLRPRPEVIDPDYFPFFIASNQFMETAIRISVGGLSPTVNWKDIEKQEFELPSIDEQRVIAKKLWAAYRLKESYKKMIDATDEMVKSQFIEMFGSQSNPKWERKKLKEIVTDDCVISYGIVQPGEELEEGVPIVRPVDLNSDYYVFPDGLKKTSKEISDAYRRTILKGDELLLCVRGTTGVMGLATPELAGGNVTRGITPLRFKEGINRIYMLCAFLSDESQKYIKDYTKGTTLKGINMDKVREITFIIPPISIQNEYECIFRQADKSKFELREAIKRVEAMMKSLMA